MANIASPSYPIAKNYENNDFYATDFKKDGISVPSEFYMRRKIWTDMMTNSACEWYNNFLKNLSNYKFKYENYSKKLFCFTWP